MLILPPWSFWIPYRCYLATFWWLLTEYIPRKIKKKFLQPRNYCLFLFESGVAKSCSFPGSNVRQQTLRDVSHYVRKFFFSAKLDFLYTDLFVNDQKKRNVVCLADKFSLLFFFKWEIQLRLAKAPPPGGGGVLPYERLMGMCCWMVSHFHDWIEYDWAAFLIDLLEWGRTFWDFLG